MLRTLALTMLLVSEMALAFPLQFDAVEAEKWLPKPTYVPDPSAGAARLSTAGFTTFVVPSSDQSMVWCRVLEDKRTARYMTVRYAAANLRPTRYFLFAFDTDNNGFELSKAADMKLDGRWTTAIYDLQAVTVGKPLAQFCLTVAADDTAPAYLTLEAIDLVDQIIGSH